MLEFLTVNCLGWFVVPELLLIGSRMLAISWQYSCESIFLVSFIVADFGGGFISIFMGLKGGARVATLVDSGIPVHMNISVRELTVYNVVSNSSMTAASSMLPSDPTFIFVSLGLLVMVVLGLVCLLVYGIRRAKCSNHKSRARIVSILHTCRFVRREKERGRERKDRQRERDGDGERERELHV